MMAAFLLVTASLFPADSANFRVYADDSGISFVGTSDFGMDNAIPGDAAVADLEIVNNSNQAFRLGIGSTLEEGDRPLHEKLNLIIRGRQGEIYSGPLSEMDYQGLGAIPAGSQELYQLELSLATAAGNDCQGQGVKMGISVIDLDCGSLVLPGNGPNLNLHLPLGLLLFLLGLFYLRPGGKEKHKGTVSSA